MQTRARTVSGRSDSQNSKSRRPDHLLGPDSGLSATPCAPGAGFRAGPLDGGAKVKRNRRRAARRGTPRSNPWPQSRPGGAPFALERPFWAPEAVKTPVKRGTASSASSDALGASVGNLKMGSWALIMWRPCFRACAVDRRQVRPLPSTSNPSSPGGCSESLSSRNF